MYGRNGKNAASSESKEDPDECDNEESHSRGKSPQSLSERNIHTKTPTSLHLCEGDEKHGRLGYKRENMIETISV
jgi:hypothetical protein